MLHTPWSIVNALKLVVIEITKKENASTSRPIIIYLFGILNLYNTPHFSDRQLRQIFVNLKT